MTGKDKAREIRNKIASETTEKPEPTKEEVEARELALARQKERLKKILEQDAQTEARESGASLPFLSLYISNRSTSLLADGKTPNDGWFYYTKTQEQFENPLVHICHVSRGFRVLKKDDKGQMVPKYMHIVSGVLEGDLKMPFFLTIGGSQRLERLWGFRDELRKYNNKGIPSYAMLVKLSSENVKIKKPDGQPGMAKVINFEVSATNGEPDVTDDYDLIMGLRRATEELRNYERQYMERYEVDEDGEKVIPQVESTEVRDPVTQLPPAAEPKQEELAAPTEDVNPDDIPF